MENLLHLFVIYHKGLQCQIKNLRLFLTISGTEELAHLEMVGSIVHQLTKNASIEEIEKAGLSAYYTDHGVDVYPQSAAGVPFTAAYLACKGDIIANLQEDLAADKKGN